MGNEWMQSPIILDHPRPDWGNSRLCLRASPIVFSYQDTLMPVMHGKQLEPADIILTQSWVNNSAGLRGGVTMAKSQTEYGGYSFGIHESLCSANGALQQKVTGNHSVCISKKASLKWSNYNASSFVYILFMHLCKCVRTYCLGLCMCVSVCTFSHSVSTLVSQRAVSERTGQYYWLFVWRVSPCRSVTLAQTQRLWLRCSDSSSVTSAAWREGWLMARTGKRCRVGSSKAQERVHVCLLVCVRQHREEG